MHLRNIPEAMRLIGQFISEMSLRDYAADLKTKSAVERPFQIMAEAAIRLGDGEGGFAGAAHCD